MKSVKKEIVNSLINERLHELTQKENPPFVFGYYRTTNLSADMMLLFLSLCWEITLQKRQSDALIAETERARKFGFLAAELERTKANLLNEAEQAFKEKDKTQSSALVSNYVNNYLEGSPIPGAENRYKFLKQVLPGITLNEINESAKKMPATTNAFALAMAPTKKKDKLPSDDELEKQIIAASKQQVKPYEEKAVASSLMDRIHVRQEK